MGEFGNLFISRMWEGLRFGSVQEGLKMFGEGMGF